MGTGTEGSARAAGVAGPRLALGYLEEQVQVQVMALSVGLVGLRHLQVSYRRQCR